MMRVGRAIAVPLISALGVACNDDPPYTPFQIASPIPSAPASAASSSVPRAESWRPKKALVAPRAATRWTLEGSAVSAPPGLVFERGLAADFDGDSKVDVVAWLVPAGATGPAGVGQLWLYSGGGERRLLLKAPGFIPTGAGCAQRASLTQTGRRTVTVAVSGSCSGRRLERSPERGVYVVAPKAAAPIVGVRAARGAPGEQLSLSVDSTDRDGDGRDDVSLTVSLEDQSTRTVVSAPFRWLVRAAGASRDRTEPAATLAASASRAQSRSGGRRTHAQVSKRVAALRRLIASICKESATFRVFDADGSGLECGSLTTTATRLVSAEVNAALKRGDAREALAALGRSDWYVDAAEPSTKTSLEKAVDRTLIVMAVDDHVAPAVRVPPRTSEPRWSPLSFDADGSLLVATPDGFSRVAPDDRTVSPLPADAAPTGWSLPVVLPGGNRWVGVLDPCDRSELVLRFEPPLPRAATLDVLSPRPGTCRGGPPAVFPAPAPIRVTADGLDALVAGSRVGAAEERAKQVMMLDRRGVPRSPDGKALVGTTARGVLITGTPKPELWRGRGIGAPLLLGECAVSNGATKVACVREDRVLIFRRPTP